MASQAEARQRILAHYEQDGLLKRIDAGLIAPGMTHVSTLGALRFMAKMMLTRAPDLNAYEAQRGLPKLAHPQLAHENPAWVRDAETRQLHL